MNGAEPGHARRRPGVRGKSFLRVPVTVLLIALLALLTARGLRERRASAQEERNSDSASGPAGKHGPQARHDFPRRPPPQDAVFPDPPAEEGPEHPWAAYLRRCAEIEKKLRETKVDLDFQDADLTTILEYFHDAASLKLNLDCPADTSAKKITFRVKDLILTHTLRLLLQQYGLTFVIAEDGQIWIVPVGEPPDQGPQVWPHEPPFIADLRRMRKASGEFTGVRKDDGGAEKNRVTLDAMKKAKVSLDVSGVPLPEAIALLQEASQINVMIDRRRIEDLEALTISARITDAPVDLALNLCLGATELDWSLEEGVVVITTKEWIQQKRDADELDKKLRREIAAAQEDLFARPVAFGAENARLRDVAELLALGLGVPYQIDPGTWSRKVRYTIEERQRPASEVVALLRKGAPVIIAYRDGILWFLSPDGVK